MKKIVQYLPFEAAKSVLSENSTFCLKSLRYYRELEEYTQDSSVADKSESEQYFEGDGNHTFNPNSVLVTCWSVLKEESMDWAMCPHKSQDVAIVSSVEKVAKLLEEFEDRIFYKKKDKKLNFEHDYVQYYDESNKPKDYSIWRAMFYKRKKFEYQNEYRFAFILDGSMKIQTLIFYVSPEEAQNYIDKIYFGNGLLSMQKQELVTGCISLGVCGKINDFDAVIRSYRKLEIKAKKKKLKEQVIGEWENAGKPNWGIKETTGICLLVNAELEAEKLNPAQGFRKAIESNNLKYVRTWVLGCHFPWLNPR